LWHRVQGSRVVLGRHRHAAGAAQTLARRPVATWAEITSRIFGLCRVAATGRSRGFQPTEVLGGIDMPLALPKR
jgi:hypothetical protein